MNFCITIFFITLVEAFSSLMLWQFIMLPRFRSDMEGPGRQDPSPNRMQNFHSQIHSNTMTSIIQDLHNIGKIIQLSLDSKREFSCRLSLKFSTSFFLSLNF